MSTIVPNVAAVVSVCKCVMYHSGRSGRGDNCIIIIEMVSTSPSSHRTLTRYTDPRRCHPGYNGQLTQRFRKERDIYKISILLELYLWLWFLVNAVQSRGSSLQNRPLVRLPTPPPTYWCIQLWLWITAASVFTISYLHLQLLNTSQWSQVSWKPFVASTLLIFIYKCFTLQQPAARRDDKLLGYFICTDINKYLRNHFRILFYSLPVRLLELETKVREALLGPSPCWNCIIVY